MHWGHLGLGGWVTGLFLWWTRSWKFTVHFASSTVFLVSFYQSTFFALINRQLQSEMTFQCCSLFVMAYREIPNSVVTAYSFFSLFVCKLQKNVKKYLQSIFWTTEYVWSFGLIVRVRVVVWRKSSSESRVKIHMKICRFEQRVLHNNEQRRSITDNSE